MFTYLLFGVLVLPVALPGFEDFQRMDRERQLTGQLQTAESLELTRVDPARIAQTAKAHATDPLIVWGAAEVTASWPAKRALFESALVVSGTNQMIALRFACAAAVQQEFDLARTWLTARDASNAVPWMLELRFRQQRGEPLTEFHPPATAMRYEDAATAAARARILALTAAGYSPYAARRLGFIVDQRLLDVWRGLAESALPEALETFVLTASRAMQQSPLLVTELVGSSMERAIRDRRAEAGSAARLTELAARRQAIALLVRETAAVVDRATEAEMVAYFDDALANGEEMAMRRLAKVINDRLRTPSP